MSDGQIEDRRKTVLACESLVRLGWGFVPVSTGDVANFLDDLAKVAHEAWIDGMETGIYPHEDVSPSEGILHAAKLIRDLIDGRTSSTNDSPPKFRDHALGGRSAGCIRELAQDFTICVWPFRIVIRAGFLTDGASVPVLLQRWAGHPFDWPRIVAAIVHDWLYAAHLLPKWLADLVFLVLLLRVGYPIGRSVADWWAVVHFGGPAWRSHGPADQAFARAHGSISICLKQKKKGKTNE